MIARNTIASVEHVWSADPALDKAAEGWADKWKAHMSGAPASTLPLVVGETATIFRLRPLDSAAWRRALPLPAMESDYEVVASCLVGVENLKIDGVPYVVERKMDRAVPKSLDAIYDPSLFHELAAKVAEASQLLPFRA